MRRLSRIFWSGMVTVLPIAITVAIVYWIGVSLEAVLGGLLGLAIPERYYVPGTGILVALLLVLLAGAVVHAWAVQKLLALGGSLIERIPLAKTIYGAVSDILAYVRMMADEKDLGNVVLVDLERERSVVGFLTSEEVPFARSDRADAPGEDPLVAVYLPMSYQLGGYTVCLPASQVRRIDMGNEAAMRWVLTAGVSRASPRQRPQEPST